MMKGVDGSPAQGMRRIFVISLKALLTAPCGKDAEARVGQARPTAGYEEAEEVECRRVRSKTGEGCEREFRLVTG